MSHLKLLLVEDEALIGFELKMMLNRAGYAVIGPVATGNEAIRITQAEKPDVVVLDIRLMGAMDGIETARQIGLISAPWIIFTTGHQDSNLKERAMALAPLAYLTKPLDWRDIDAAVQARLITQTAG